MDEESTAPPKPGPSLTTKQWALGYLAAAWLIIQLLDVLREPWPESDRLLFASGIAYGPEQFAILQGPQKYVWHERSRAGTLFDLVRDPAESAPLEDESVAAQLDADLDEYLLWYDERQFDAPNLSEEQLEQLKGIGYLQGVGDDEDEQQSPDDK